METQVPQETDLDLIYVTTYISVECQIVCIIRRIHLSFFLRLGKICSSVRLLPLNLL